MKKKKTLYTRIIALLLVVVTLYGCGSNPTNPSVQIPGQTLPSLSQTDETEGLPQLSQPTRDRFEQLTEEFFRDQVTQSGIDLHYTLKDPGAYGITDFPATLGSYNLDEMKEDLEKYKALAGELRDLDKQQLSEDQQITYDILLCSLDGEIALEGFELYQQPLGPTIGLQAQLPVLLAEYTFYDKQDVENYLLLLEDILPFFEEIIAFEKQQAMAGLFMTDTSIDQVIASCSGYLVDPSESFLNETFESRLVAIEGLTEEEVADFMSRNLSVLENCFLPAYQMLVTELEGLKGSGTNQQGLCFFPQGNQYYERLVQAKIAPSYQTIDELKNAIEKKLKADAVDIIMLLKENPSIAEQIDSYGFSLTDPPEILEHLKQQMMADFPALDDCNYTVKYVPEALESSLSPAFYLTPPLDDYKDNVIYINSGSPSSKDLYSILAHEGYPGHLYQTVYFTGSDASNLRRALSFTSYSEGWAVYVENYSYTFDNGLDPALGKLLALNSSSTLGLHALLELNVNYYGWTPEEMKKFLSSYYMMDENDSYMNELVNDLYYTVIANPTNYLEYYTGYLEMMDLRAKAEKQLGDAFDIKDFHKFILDIGPAPFTVINNYFDRWIENPK